MTEKTMIMVAPNGARRTKADHPNLPITPDEMVEAVVAARAAGAAAAHVHVRDASCKHTLDAAIYTGMLSALETAVGQTMVVQMTTEAVGIYSADEQMEAVRAVKPVFVSMAIAEIVGDGDQEAAAREFFRWLQDNNIVPQFILYDAADLARFIDLQNRAIVPFSNPFLLFVLGRYCVDQQSSPEQLDPFLDVLGTRQWPFMLCAFGRQEAACMAAGIAAGGHVRVGFENNLNLPDGSQAKSNADLVNVAAREVRAAGKSVMDGAEARRFISSCLV